MKTAYFTSRVVPLATIALASQFSFVQAAEQAAAGTAASVSTTPVATAPVGSAVKSVWASGLRAPQGMARDAVGNIYVAEYQGGQVSKFSPEGKPLGKVGGELKNPAWVAFDGDTLYISERKANRVLKADAVGKVTVVDDNVIEPLGLAIDNSGNPVVVAHTTSRLLRLGDNGKFASVYDAPTGKGKRYGYRCVAVDRDGSLLITDEAEGQVLLLTPSGRLAVYARDLDDPTTVVFSPRGEVFVAEEGAGRISRLNAQGEATVVAEGLGKPRDIEFVDERTLLVSDQENGRVWKVVLP
jgi:sugar lactone lactonase YvrE